MLLSKTSEREVREGFVVWVVSGNEARPSDCGGGSIAYQRPDLTTFLVETPGGRGVVCE